MDYQKFLNDLFNKGIDDESLVRDALSNIPENSDQNTDNSSTDYNTLVNSILEEGTDSNVLDEVLSNIYLNQNSDENEDNRNTNNDTLVNYLLEEGTDSSLVRDALSNILENSDQNKDNRSTDNNTFFNSLLDGDISLLNNALSNLDISENPNSDNSTVSVLNDEVTNSNDNNWSLPNVEVTNGNNHCWMAALLAVVSLLHGAHEILNSLFGINLNQTWDAAMYNTINSKLQSEEVLCDQERDSNDNNWSLPNVEVTNGNNHCWMAALLSVVSLLHGAHEILNSLFGINLNQTWDAAMYNTINSKLQSEEVLCDQERDSTNMGNPQILLIYLQSIWQQKSSNRIYFHGLEAQDDKCLLASITQPTVKGIVYHTGNMSSNISMNSDQNVFHWKSIIRNPNGGWYNFDSANGGYNHSLITDEEAGAKLLGKHILIISS